MQVNEDKGVGLPHDDVTTWVGLHCGDTHVCGYCTCYVHDIVSGCASSTTTERDVSSRKCDAT